MPGLRTHIRKFKGNVKVLVLSGDLDIEGVDKLRKKIDRLVSGKTSHLVLDLAKVTHLCSGAASLLYYYQKKAPHMGTGFGLLTPSAEARTVIDLVGGDRIFRIGHTLEELVGVREKRSKDEAEGAGRRSGAGRPEAPGRARKRTRSGRGLRGRRR